MTVEPVLVLYNAKIFSSFPQKSAFSALAIQNGRILAIGQQDTILSKFGPAGQTVDLHNRVVLPGLIDTHIHLAEYALSIEKVNCETETKEACLQRIAEKAKNARPGEWILGHGWNQNVWFNAANSSGEVKAFSQSSHFPTAADLDVVAPNNPVYLTAKSLHAAWVNNLALNICGINANTPDPPGGAILRASGKSGFGPPSGILFESAMDLVLQCLPETTVERIAQAILSAQKLLWRMGITTVNDFDSWQCMKALQGLHEQGALKLRVCKGIHFESLPQAVDLGLTSGAGDNFLRIGAVKVFADGALGPRTAAMLQPYDNDPDDSDNLGMLLLDSRALFEIGRQVVESGFNLAVHAIGDRANRQVLDGFTLLRQYELEHHLSNKPYPSLCHRIEHVQLIDDADAGRLAALKIIASMQPIHATSDMLMADRYWGKRSSNAYAWKTLLDHGTVIAFGSDAPVESPNPFWGLHAAITRRRLDGTPDPLGWQPRQRLTLTEALQAYTSSAAFAVGMENKIGKLAPGYCADLIVLDDDLFKCGAEAIKDILPIATMVNGEWVFNDTFK